MVKLEDEMDRCKTLLAEMLGGHASSLLLERYMDRFDDVENGEVSLEETLRAIHISLRLFVDETLAAMIDKRLRAMGRETTSIG